jgi:hypothetical protein
VTTEIHGVDGDYRGLCCVGVFARLYLSSGFNVVGQFVPGCASFVSDHGSPAQVGQASFGSYSAGCVAAGQLAGVRIGVSRLMFAGFGAGCSGVRSADL